LLVQVIRLADDLARVNAGSNSAAKTAMMAMTTSSSIKVNARFIFSGGSGGNEDRAGQAWLSSLSLSGGGARVAHCLIPLAHLHSPLKSTSCQN
jgi:hypothetical protein